MLRIHVFSGLLKEREELACFVETARGDGSVLEKRCGFVGRVGAMSINCCSCDAVACIEI